MPDIDGDACNRPRGVDWKTQVRSTMNVIRRLVERPRRRDRLGWWPYFGSFGDDFFSEE